MDAKRATIFFGKKMNGHLISYMNNKLFSSLLMLIYFIYELLRYFYEKQ